MSQSAVTLEQWNGRHVQQVVDSRSESESLPLTNVREKRESGKASRSLCTTSLTTHVHPLLPSPVSLSSSPAHTLPSSSQNNVCGSIVLHAIHALSRLFVCKQRHETINNRYADPMFARHADRHLPGIWITRAAASSAALRTSPSLSSSC